LMEFCNPRSYSRSGRSMRPSPSRVGVQGELRLTKAESLLPFSSTRLLVVHLRAVAPLCKLLGTSTQPPAGEMVHQPVKEVLLVFRIRTRTATRTGSTGANTPPHRR
jgi:hypothetical protein